MNKNLQTLDEFRDHPGDPLSYVNIHGFISKPDGQNIVSLINFDTEEEIDLGEPGMRDVYEEELYEAALKGLNIELVDNKAQQRKAVVQQAKKRIYERVIKRLIAESKK